MGKMVASLLGCTCPFCPAVRQLPDISCWVGSLRSRRHLTRLERRAAVPALGQEVLVTTTTLNPSMAARLTAMIRSTWRLEVLPEKGLHSHSSASAYVVRAH